MLIIGIQWQAIQKNNRKGVSPPAGADGIRVHFSVTIW